MSVQAVKDGSDAFKEGKEMWQNPHVYMTSSRDDFIDWLSGWMWEKQRRQRGEYDNPAIDTLGRGDSGNL